MVTNAAAIEVSCGCGCWLSTLYSYIVLAIITLRFYTAYPKGLQLIWQVPNKGMGDYLLPLHTSDEGKLIRLGICVVCKKIGDQDYSDRQTSLENKQPQTSGNTM